MGRKSNSKQAGKKLPGKEISKFEMQKKKELGVLVDKLLKLTSIFQPTLSAAKSWEHHLEIEALVSEIQNVESSTDFSPRQSNFDEFFKWLRSNEAQYDGLEVSEFKGYELGLKATKDFKEGSLVLTVPRKVMMSEQDAKDSELGLFIDMDPLLQNMPNITLALFLLLEKSKPDSFWKPYIDILPEKYSTVLYFTSDELSELKPSPVLDSALKLYRSIARQYSYFYNRIHTRDLPVLTKLREIFTFDSYRWAVSTVMTRQNNVNLSDTETTAFIPLWDLCNHEHGKITTGFNKETSRGECYALRDFKAGEQIFIFYGARPNCDLFLHNGFVYPNNQHDKLSLVLGVSSSDPLRESRVRLLNKLGLGTVTHYSLFRSDTPLSPELLAFIRIFSMNQDDLDKWLLLRVPSDLVSAEPSSVEAVGEEIDIKAYKYLLTRCILIKASYATKESEFEPDEGDVHRQNIRVLKQCEVEILQIAIKYLEDTLEIMAPETEEE